MLPPARTVPVVLALLVSLTPACQDPDPAILVLNGETVRRSEFDRHVATFEASGLGPIDPEARRGLLQAFLEQRALVFEARRRGFLDPGAGVEEEPRAVARLLAEAVSPPEVTEEEIAAYYGAHAAELALPEAVTLRQILLPTQSEARDIRRRLVRDPKAFDALARSRSKGPEAAAGGHMGTFSRGQLPQELEEAAFSLPEGATSEPVATALGYHVMRVESRQQPRELTLDEARDRIAARLAREKRAEAERAFVAEILARSKVNHEAALSHALPS